MTKSNTSAANAKKIKVEDILNYLAGGFLRGNIGFIKSNTTERIKGPTTVQREIRIGVTHVSNTRKFSIDIKSSVLLDLRRISS
jgi:hypothetical protein